MMRRDLILHKTEIRKLNDHCKCGLKCPVKKERGVSLEYATLVASEHSSVAQMVMEPQVCVT